MLKIYHVYEQYLGPKEVYTEFIKSFMTKSSADNYCKELYNPTEPEFSYFVVEGYVYG